MFYSIFPGLRIWVLLLVLSACGGSTATSTPTPTPVPVPVPTPEPTRGTLVSITSSATIDVTVVNYYISEINTIYGVDTSALSGNRYSISIQKIVYKTVTPDGRLIDVSGIMAYPIKAQGVSSPVLSYQHGTIFQDSEAPSMQVVANIDPVLIVMAGSGFIVTMPDYVGYATSTNEIHPYIHAQSTAAATVDMLRATRKLLADKNIPSNGQLFLTGYSEGGYATLAAQKEMEQNLSAEFPLTASMPAAGPYDMTGTTQYWLGLTTNPNPQFISFVFKAYDYWYGWNSINRAFQSPYNNVIATGFDGSMSGANIYAALTTGTASLFNNTFRTDFSGNGEAAIKADIAKNNLLNWAPTTPTHLFHGQDDDVVPYANTTAAFSAMTSTGSTSVTVVNCITGSTPRGHSECFWNYLSQGLNWYVPMALNL